MTAATQTPLDIELAILAAERRAALWRADAQRAADIGDTITRDRCLQRAENEARAARMLRERLTVTTAGTQA